MPYYSDFRDFIRALREHAREHADTMMPADVPPNVGYACTQCEGIARDEGFLQWLLPIHVIRAETLRAARGSALIALLSYFEEVELRQRVPIALRNGGFDVIPWLAADAFDQAVQEELGPPMTDEERRQLISTRRDGLIDRLPPRAVPNVIPTIAPETAPRLEWQEYRRRPETVRAVEIAEAGWYDVEGVGVSRLNPGLYVFHGDSLVTREPDAFHEQYEKVERPPAETPATTPLRFDRNEVV